MAEACTVLHAENKRSLPAWMLKSSSGSQEVKTKDRNEKTSESDVQTRNLDQIKPIKRNTGRGLKNVDSEGAGELGVLRKCEVGAKASKTSKNAAKDGSKEMENIGRRMINEDSEGAGELGVLRKCEGRAKARKISKNAAKDEAEEVENTGRLLINADSVGDGELGVLRRCESRRKSRRMSKNVVKDEAKEIVEVASKNPRKATKGAALKNSRKRKLENAKSEESSPETIDDEIELTMEDLVSIAEEYVNADKQKQQELENMKTARRYEHKSCPTVSAECSTITRNTSPSEHGRDENSSHQELQYSSSFKTTEDVYQDMLNLFLNPLSSKAASYLKEPEPKELVTTSIYHVPKKKDWHSEVPRQAEPVGKKKSSLKDKVALFL